MVDEANGDRHDAEEILDSLVRGLRDSGFVDRVVQVGGGAPLRKGEYEAIRVLSKDVLLPALRLRIALLKAKAAAAAKAAQVDDEPEEDEEDEESIEDLQGEMDLLRKNDPRYLKAKKAREGGGLERE